jgi:hypothetical protein
MTFVYFLFLLSREKCPENECAKVGKIPSKSLKGGVKINRPVLGQKESPV